MTQNTNQTETGGVTDEERRRAMATYSGDGQNDDATGGDALAEVWQARGADEPEGTPADQRPTPDADTQGATGL
jgi:hypothetical protein